MHDSCNPTRDLKLKTFRIYSIVFPIIIFVLMLEAVFVFMAIPEKLGNALTITGSLPKLADGIKI